MRLRSSSFGHGRRRGLSCRGLAVRLRKLGDVLLLRRGPRGCGAGLSVLGSRKILTIVRSSAGVVATTTSKTRLSSRPVAPVVMISRCAVLVPGVLRHVECAGAMRRGARVVVAHGVARIRALAAFSLATLPRRHGGGETGLDAEGRDGGLRCRKVATHGVGSGCRQSDCQQLK